MWENKWLQRDYRWGFYFGSADEESALAEKAQAVLDQHERITLSERDFARFVALIESPPPPTPALREALAGYKKLKAEDPDSSL